MVSSAITRQRAISFQVEHAQPTYERDLRDEVRMLTFQELYRIYTWHSHFTSHPASLWLKLFILHFGVSLLLAKFFARQII